MRLKHPSAQGPVETRPALDVARSIVVRLDCLDIDNRGRMASKSVD